jgi:hypothetical protein
MDIRVYNVDSKFRNTTSYPSSSDFVFNRVEQNDGSTYIDGNIVKNNYTIEPFNEKNVIEINILSLELPTVIYYLLGVRNNNTITLGAATITIPEGSYTKAELASYLNTSTALPNIDVTYSSNTDKITIVNNNADTISFPASNTSYYSLGDILGFNITTTIANGETKTSDVNMKDAMYDYFFLRINDFGNIINKNRNYVSKITPNSTITNIIGTKIKFDQPTDIPNLRISLEDKFGNNVSLDGNDFSFTLEVIVITNTILKNFSEIRFYKEEVMDRLLKAKMLAYYEKQVEPSVNNTLTNTYNSNLINLNTQQEFNVLGSKNNYSPMFSYFKEN